MGQYSTSFNNWKEARRKRAFELKRQGWKQRTIAAAFGISEATVSKWVADMDKLGTEGWRSKPYGHRPRKLREEHLQRIPELLRAYPNNPEARKAIRAQAKWRNAR